MAKTQDISRLDKRTQAKKIRKMVRERVWGDIGKQEREERIKLQKRATFYRKGFWAMFGLVMVMAVWCGIVYAGYVLR